MTDKRHAPPKPNAPEAPDTARETDALKDFLAGQARKCTAHHREQTAEVLALIRKHQKR
jgi:hypothetical protein